MADKRDIDPKLEEELLKRWDPEKWTRLQSLKQGKGQRLDVSTRDKYEKRLGVDLSDVRIFTGTLADEITTAHGAAALTLGDTGMILMRQTSQFTPGTAAGEALLAHELTHVAQARPSLQRKEVSDTPLATNESEAEAESVEATVLAEEKGDGGGSPAPSPKESEGAKARRLEKIVQRVWALWEEQIRLEQMRSGD